MVEEINDMSLYRRADVAGGWYFFTVVAERRRDIGMLRAIGASRRVVDAAGCGRPGKNGQNRQLCWRQGLQDLP